jgi:hypothetical protein
MNLPPGFLDRPVGQLSVGDLRIAAGNAALLAAQDAVKRPVGHGDGMPAQVNPLAFDGAADQAGAGRCL